jgi:hypothetical protein
MLLSLFLLDHLLIRFCRTETGKLFTQQRYFATETVTPIQKEMNKQDHAARQEKVLEAKGKKKEEHMESAPLDENFIPGRTL